jgi:ribose 1,5-bisphosphate isomerase
MESQFYISKNLVKSKSETDLSRTRNCRAKHFICVNRLYFSMTSKQFKETIADIKALKIQGSSKVRKAAVNALKRSVSKSKAKTLVAFRREIERHCLAILKSRPTEPETRTALRIILKAASLHSRDLQEVRDHVVKTIAQYEKDRKQAMEKIALYGSRLIEKGDTLMTHCHSHTVEEIFKKARKKIEMVYCTETRPLFQGRITAANLAKAGIPVTLIVDSAADKFMHPVDKLFIGCDAVLSDGSAVNKIGSGLIANSAKKHHNPLFVCTSSHCFDPATYFGFEEKIEERDKDEVWKAKPKGVRIRNPAFDLVDAFYIQAIVSEIGVFDPENFALEMYDRLNLGTRQEPFMGLLDTLRKKGK